jgi:putative ABC transport system permease protein
VAFTNNELFDVFTYHWLNGNQHSALTQPNTVVITSALAKKYFNTDDAVGKTIRLDDKYNMLITGVIAPQPDNTDIKADMLISLSSFKGIYPDMARELWSKWDQVDSKTNIFVLLNSPASQQQVSQTMGTIIKKIMGKDVDVTFHLQPLNDIHFNSLYSGVIAKPLLGILTLIGLALLLIAGVNFVNMATAQSITRAKEIGTRKVLGSSRKGIFWQFITETTYVVLFAAVIALLLTLLVLPTLNNWLQLHLSISGNVFIFLAPLLILLIFLAGFYPAVVLSNFKPVNALKNVAGKANAVSGLSRGALIVVQNVIAQLLIICTLIITLQVKHLKNADIGFNKDAVVMVPIPDNDVNNLTYLRTALGSYPGIKNVSYCYSGPSAITNKGGSIRYDGKEWENFNVNSMVGDENYLKTFGLTLLAGRYISPQNPTAEFIINQQLLAKLHIKTPADAIGHQLTAGDFHDKKGTIVGVVKDFNSLTLYAPVQPLLIAAQPDYYKYAAIKIAGNGQSEMINAIKLLYQKVYPHNVFEYHFLDQQIADFYKQEEMINKLIKTGAIIAIAISCLGLLGLISLITVQRTKEIGIRKVLGASISTIVSLLTRDFVKLILIAVLISTPVAWWLMHNWLQNFAYKIDVKWWFFGASAIVTLVIACLTVGTQAIKAALANPVNSLRDN